MAGISHIERTEAPGVTEPVSTADAKAFMQVDYADHDPLIADMIASARQDLEQHLNFALVETTVRLTIDNSICDTPVLLPFAKRIEDVTVSELDSELELDGGAYKIRGGALFISNTGFFSVAYTIEPDVNKSLREAIKMLVAYRYNNRGDQKEQQGIPQDITAKIAKYRVPWL